MPTIPTGGIIAEPVDRARYAWYVTRPVHAVYHSRRLQGTPTPRARPTSDRRKATWSRWFLMAGRGFGKTKAGPEWVRHLAETGQAERIALMAPTAAAIRNVMIEGKSGILAVVFGEPITERWPRHLVVDGLDQIEVLLGAAPAEPRILIHPRCTHLIHAFQNYRRAERDGEFLDTPLDPQHKAEDLRDALPGGSAMRCPEAAKPRRIFGRSRLNGFSDVPHRRQAETSVRAGPSSKRSVGAALALAFHVHPLLDLFETTGEILMVLGSHGHP